MTFATKHAGRYRPQPGEIEPQQFYERLAVCQNCQHRRANRCAVSREIVTLNARNPAARCQRREWPGDTPPPRPAPTNPAALVTLFDPAGSAYLADNYRRFRDALDPRLPVHVVEISYTGQFIEPAATLRIHATDSQRLWQKERALNLLIDQVPAEVDALFWMDADIIFDRPDWLDDALAALATADVVFPYATIARLDADGGIERRQRSAPLIETEPPAAGAPRWHNDKALGLTWGMRREWIDRHRFADYHLNGAGDAYDYFAITGETEWAARHCSPELLPLWNERRRQLAGTHVAHIAGNITHLFHGSKNNRQYKPLEDLLAANHYKPGRDAAIATNGLWEWTGRPEVYRQLAESFHRREGRGNGRRYSDFLKTETGPFWKSHQAEWILSKRAGKRVARRLGLPVPRTYKLPAAALLKPDRDCGGRRVRVIDDPAAWMLEEHVPHEFDYKLMTFSGRARLMQVDQAEERPGGMKIIRSGHYTVPDWKPMRIDNSGEYEWLDAPRPACLEQMAAMAERVARHVRIPVRVDFFIDRDGRPIFNELCVTPGLVTDGRITDAGDLWCGQWLSTPQLNLRQQLETEPRRDLPADTGLLTAADAAFFGGFQLLYFSVVTRYRCPVAVVDLGFTPHQRQWCNQQADLTVIYCPDTLPVPRTVDDWQHWNRPHYFRLSPFRRNIWLDSDCIVAGQLDELAERLASDLFAAECFAPWKRRERIESPHHNFGTQPSLRRPVMSGVCGFDVQRDAATLTLWTRTCQQLARLPAETRILRDQEALQWVFDVEQRDRQILNGRRWNECDAAADRSTPQTLFATLPAGPSIIHYYGRSKGSPPFWKSWGQIPIW